MQRNVTVLVVLGALLLACTSDEVTPTATPEASAMPETSATGTATPAWVRPEPTVSPEREPHALFEGETGLVWESYVPVPTEDGGWWQHGTRLYDRHRDEFWRLRGPEDEPYYLALSPTHDLAFAAAVDADASPDAPSVLIDLATGEMRPITPFALSSIDSWQGVESLSVGTIQARIWGWRVWEGVRWDAGLYEIDLGAGEIHLVRPDAGGYPARRDVPAPAGSVFETGGSFARRIYPDLGWAALIFRAPDGTEEVLVEPVAGFEWSPDERQLLVHLIEDEQERMMLFDPVTGVTRELDDGASNYGHPFWSPDGRFLAVNGDPGDLRFYDTTEPASPLEPFLGPIETSIFADWGPGETPSEALLLGDYCVSADGFRLDRLDLETGEVRRIPTEVGGFWSYGWSPEGDVIAVSSFDLPREFALIDAETGEDVTPGTLRDAVTSMQDLRWSASGRWLDVHGIGGRDRCHV